MAMQQLDAEGFKRYKYLLHKSRKQMQHFPWICKVILDQYKKKQALISEEADQIIYNKKIPSLITITTIEWSSSCSRQYYYTHEKREVKLEGIKLHKMRGKK